MISVIVPIYNVAPYLNRCLDSLRNQSYKNFEVIMVNDGSTDESGEIAKTYSKIAPPSNSYISTKRIRARVQHVTQA